jgi:hypothetical protein
MTTLTHEELRKDSPLKMPPSARDFDAYRLVMVEKKSTREAAKLLRISQTRVCQVISRVGEYLVDVTEPETEERRAKQLAVSVQLAAAEIEYCKDRAQRSFDGVQRLQTIREVRDAQGQTTCLTLTRECSHEPRYLTTVARLAIIGSKLPGCTLPIAFRQTFDEDGADDFASDEIDAGVIEDEIAPADSVAAAEVITPSEEACSVEASEQGFTATSEPSENVANCSAELICDEPSERSPSHKVEISHPVHRAVATQPPTALDELARAGVLKQMAIELSPFARAAMNIE